MNHDYTHTRYTQAVGGMGNYGSYWSGKPPEQLTYPNEAGSPYLPQFGQEEPPTAPSAAPTPEPLVALATTGGTMVGLAYSALTIAGGAVGIYHGYKRNDSVGWALVWGFMGSLVPIIVIPLAYAQGIGKRKR